MCGYLQLQLTELCLHCVSRQPDTSYLSLTKKSALGRSLENTLQVNSMSSSKPASDTGILAPSTKPEAHSDKSPAVEPSGPKGDNPATAGPGETSVKSPTPENAKGHLNPSAPEDSNTTPGSTTTK
ncbi:hypothetical protein BH10ACI4_BH10ACI4_15920 [soil metagenome]